MLEDYIGTTAILGVMEGYVIVGYEDLFAGLVIMGDGVRGYEMGKKDW